MRSTRATRLFCCSSAVPTPVIKQFLHGAKIGKIGVPALGIHTHTQTHGPRCRCVGVYALLLFACIVFACWGYSVGSYVCTRGMYIVYLGIKTFPMLNPLFRRTLGMQVCVCLSP